MSRRSKKIIIFDDRRVNADLKPRFPSPTITVLSQNWNKKSKTSIAKTTTPCLRMRHLYFVYFTCSGGGGGDGGGCHGNHPRHGGVVCQAWRARDDDGRPGGATLRCGCGGWCPNHRHWHGALKHGRCWRLVGARHQNDLPRRNTLSWVAAFAAIVHSEQGSTLFPGLPKKQTSPIRWKITLTQSFDQAPHKVACPSFPEKKVPQTSFQVGKGVREITDNDFSFTKLAK